MTPIFFLILWSMPFYVPVDGGYQEWELQIVDELCNSIECIGGLTSAYPIATIQIPEDYIFSQVRDQYGCTVLGHEIYHAWYGDYYHEEISCGLP